MSLGAARWMVAAVVALALPRAAHADRAAADRLAAHADERAAAGDFVGAAHAYLGAYAADPRPELVCDAGVAYYKLADLPRAVRYLHDCVDTGAGLDAAFVARVRAALSAVEAALVTQNLTPVDLVLEPATATATVELWPDEPIVGGRRVWMPYGHHRIVVRAPGYAERVLEVDTSSHEPSVQRVTLERAAAAPPSPLRQQPPPGPASASVNRRRGAPTALWIGAGAIAVAGGAFHIASAFERSKLTDGDAGDYSDHLGAFHRDRAIAIGGYGAAVITGAIGLYLDHRARRERVELGADVGHGAAALTIEWHR